MIKPVNDPEGIRPRRFAEKYGVAENLVYRGCRDGSIPCVRLGNRFVILWREWEKLASARAPGNE